MLSVTAYVYLKIGTDSATFTGADAYEKANEYVHDIIAPLAKTSLVIGYNLDATEVPEPTLTDIYEPTCFEDLDLLMNAVRDFKRGREWWPMDNLNNAYEAIADRMPAHSNEDEFSVKTTVTFDDSFTDGVANNEVFGAALFDANVLFDANGDECDDRGCNFDNDYRCDEDEDMTMNELRSQINSSIMDIRNSMTEVSQSLDNLEAMARILDNYEDYPIEGDNSDDCDCDEDTNPLTVLECALGKATKALSMAISNGNGEEAVYNLGLIHEIEHLIEELA